MNFYNTTTFSNSSSSVIRGNGKLASENRQMLKNFTKVSVEDIISLVITRGDKCLITIIAESNIIPLVKIQLRGSELRVFLEGSIITSGEVQVLMTVKDPLEKISVSGASKALAHGVMTSSVELSSSGTSYLIAGGQTLKKVEVSASGASNCVCETDMFAEKIFIDVSGTANVEMNAAKHNAIDASGASSVKLRGDSEKAKVDMSGTSSLKMNAPSEEVTGSCFGCSSIKLKGQSKKVDVDCSGCAKLTRG